MKVDAKRTGAVVLPLSLFIVCLVAYLSVAPRNDKSRSPWQPVALRSAETAEAGHRGGEGGQVVRAIAFDRDKGNLVMYGTDVGGLYRSLDGGVGWEPSNVGYTPRGTCSMAIDPNNPKRVLSVGANSVAGEFNGIYLSEDGAASWRQVLPANISSAHDEREQLAYDPTSHDGSKGMTTRVYWSRVSGDEPSWGTAEEYPMVYRSDDGGETWKEIPGTEEMGGSILKVHPTKGWVYAANPRGLFISKDRGKTWKTLWEGEVTGLETTPSRPDDVWICSFLGVMHSKDAGRHFKELKGNADIVTGDPIRGIKVSPADPARMLCWRQGDNWNFVRFASDDGGKSWTQSAFDDTNAFLPNNARFGHADWHPTDPNIVVSTGGDWPTRSTDGGKTFAWSADGFNAILVGGQFNFNAQDPDLLFVGSQDYNGAVTTDGGKTWKYVNPSGNGWGGYTYGGHAASKDVLYVGNAAGWGEPRYLTVSRDGGDTWEDTGLAFEGPDVSYGHPKDPKVLFASNLRSTDGGLNWEPMDGCRAVYTSVTGKSGKVTLYGRDDMSVVSSVDKGKTWRGEVFVGNIDDIAVDPRTGRVYVATDGNLQAYDPKKDELSIVDTPLDSLGNQYIKTVAVDPVDPSVVYIGNNKNIYAASNSVCRSLDSGKTWDILTLQKPINKTNYDGGREAFCIRVHPVTREAWAATNCYGIWKVSPPPSK